MTGRSSDTMRSISRRVTASTRSLPSAARTCFDCRRYSCTVFGFMRPVATRAGAYSSKNRSSPSPTVGASRTARCRESGSASPVRIRVSSSPARAPRHLQRKLAHLGQGGQPFPARDPVAQNVGLHPARCHPHPETRHFRVPKEARLRPRFRVADSLLGQHFGSPLAPTRATDLLSCRHYVGGKPKYRLISRNVN